MQVYCNSAATLPTSILEVGRLPTYLTKNINPDPGIPSRMKPTRREKPSFKAHRALTVKATRGLCRLLAGCLLEGDPSRQCVRSESLGNTDVVIVLYHSSSIAPVGAQPASPAHFRRPRCRCSIVCTRVPGVYDPRHTFSGGNLTDQNG